jgi:hypothetical protein
MAVEVVRYLTHHRVKPEAVGIFLGGDGFELLEHRGAIRFVRHPVPPPDHHRRGADLAVRDPAELRLEIPAGDPLRAAERAALRGQRNLSLPGLGQQPGGIGEVEVHVTTRLQPAVELLQDVAERVGLGGCHDDAADRTHADR